MQLFHSPTLRLLLLLPALARIATCAPVHTSIEGQHELKESLLGQFSPPPGEEAIETQAGGGGGLAAWTNSLTSMMADWNPYGREEGSSSRSSRSSKERGKGKKRKEDTYQPPLAKAKIKISDFLRRGVMLHYRGPGRMTAEQYHMSILFPLRMMQLQYAEEYGEKLGILVEDSSSGGDAAIYLGLTNDLAELDKRSKYLDDKREQVTSQPYFLRLSSYTSPGNAPHMFERDDPRFIRQTTIQAAYVLMMHARGMGFDLERLEDKRGTRSSDPVVDIGADLRRAKWL